MGEGEGAHEPQPQPASDVPLPPVPEAMVRLESGDGFSFTVDIEYARVSPVIDAMLSSPFRESRTRVVHLPHVRGCILELACQYFYYVARHRACHAAAASLPPTPALHLNPPSGTDPQSHTRDSRPNQLRPSAPKDTAKAADVDVATFYVPPHLAVDLFLFAKYLNL